MKPEFNFSQVGERASIVLTEQKGPEPLPIFKETIVTGNISAPAEFYKKNLVEFMPVSEGGKSITALFPNSEVSPESEHKLFQVRIGDGFVTSIVADPSKSMVEIDEENCSIRLTVGYDQYPRIVIKGDAVVNPIFKELGINSGNGYTAKDMALLLQSNMRIFESKSAFVEARKRFTNFSAKVTKIQNETNDQKGNKSNSAHTTVDGFGMESIIIHVPIFKGQDPVHFSIDLECEEVMGTLRFFLVSFELEKTIMEAKKSMLQAESQKFGKLPIIWS